jgi:acyl transferase domain-containing protein
MAATLRRGSNDNAQLAETLAQLYVRGMTVDFAAVHAQRPSRKLSLPTYPFQRQRYWLRSSRPKGVPLTNDRTGQGTSNGERQL